MHDGHAILRAVLSDPADDAPRLVYADWLDEQGDPALAARADLIRRMIALPQYVFTREQVPGRRPMQGHYGPVWAMNDLRPLLTAVGRDEWGPLRDVHEVKICRGFAESVVVSLAGFPRLAGRLFAAHPITFVTLAGLTKDDFTGSSSSGVLAIDPTEPGQWPAALFPDHPPGTEVRLPTTEGGPKSLREVALAYGRRLAGVTVVEPKPVARVKAARA